MEWMRTVAREVWGLFVDDGRFAIAIVVWVGLVWLLERRFEVGGTAGAAALFGGLGMVLVVSLCKFARRNR